MEEIGDLNVRVAVRCRPFNSTEIANNEGSCVTIHKDRIVISNPNSANDEQSFAFDLIFDQFSYQTSVWDAIGAPILSKAFDGYNGTIFAYGQTGSGKEQKLLKTILCSGGGQSPLFLILVMTYISKICLVCCNILLSEQ